MTFPPLNNRRALDVKPTYKTGIKVPPGIYIDSERLKHVNYDPGVPTPSGRESPFCMDPGALDQRAPHRAEDLNCPFGCRDAMEWAMAFYEINPGVLDVATIAVWFASAIETGAMDEAKKRTTRERHERHILSVITRWREDEFARKMNFKSTVREEEERLVAALLKMIEETLPG